MAAPSFFWHDYETFGINPRLDRPSQFAGIRTDYDLNPIGEPVDIFCQPADDVLPHPEACLITGITPQQAQDQGVPEPQFIKIVLAELGAANTCAVGYNSLRFDDEVTRHTAWRNFHDPYAREWKNGCSRWDIIDMVRLCHALRPEGIEWPKREDGQTSFKLEWLAEANQLVKTRAHDALSDVETTIALARLVREKQPRLYDYAFSNKDKASAGTLLNLAAHDLVLHVSQKIPAQYGCLTAIMPIARHPKNKNAVLCFDLRQDPQALLELDTADLHERIFASNDDLPEGVERIAVKGVHLNKCPVLAPIKTLTAERAEVLQLDLKVCADRRELILGQLNEVAAKLTEVFELGEFPPNSDPEQDLYGGFVGDNDRQLCQQVLDAIIVGPPEELPFSDNRLHELLLRYRARHFPDSLNEAEQQEWQNWRSNRIEFAPDGGLALDDYRQMIAVLKTQTQEPDHQRILAELSDWGESLL